MDSQIHDCQLLDAPAAARLLGISRRKLWALTQAGRVPYLRIDRCVRYPLNRLVEWIDEQTAEPTDARDAATSRSRPVAD